MKHKLETTISIQDKECRAEIEYSWDKGQSQTMLDPGIPAHAVIEKITAWFPIKSRVFDAQKRGMVEEVQEKELDMLSPEYSFLIDDDGMWDLQIECRVHHNEHDEELRAEYMAQICETK